MRTIFLLLLFILIVAVKPACAQKWLSASAIIGTQAVYNQAIAADGNGNVYVVGSFSDQANVFSLVHSISAYCLGCTPSVK